MSLDKGKPYGTIFGAHEGRYVQNGIEYGTNGEPIKKKAARKKAAPKVKEEVKVNDVS